MVAFRLSVVILMIAMLGAIVMLTRKEKKNVIDYFEWFMIGIIWLILGIILRDLLLLSLGLVFSAVSYYNKKVWKKNHKANAWDKLTKFEKKIKIVLMIMMAVLIVLGLVIYIMIV